MRTSIYLIILLLFPVLLPIQGCTSRNEQPPKNLDLLMTWQLITNFKGEGNHLAKFTILNNSDRELNAKNWEMYWNMAPREIIQESIKVPVKIEWINGDFYRMKPLDGFTLPPGKEITIEYEGSYAMIKETDAPLGLYSVFYGKDENSWTYAINDYKVLPFDTPDKINRGEGDLEPIPTAEWLFEHYANIHELPMDQVPPLVPSPQSIKTSKDSFEINANTQLFFDPGLENEANYLKEALDEFLTEGLKVKNSTEKSSNTIRLQNSPVANTGSYTLVISGHDGVTISGDNAGVFYGIQTILGLIPIGSMAQKSAAISIKSVTIDDSPAFSYRGMHVDVARNFNSLQAIKHLIDAMAFYKLNKLHLHLTEDEAWRLEIEELPELTAIGAFRGHTLDDSEHLQPSYGSGPLADDTKGHGSGFYSREQYKDLLQYAWNRHIEVIPEVNVPGHSRAAIKAMEYRYTRLVEEGREDLAKEFRLADPEDTSEYRSAQWYTDNVICVCRESAYKFFTTVVDDIIEMHEEAGVPLTMIHTGGDEVPAGAWAGSPLCIEYLKEHPEIDNPQNLQKDFFRKINNYLTSKGLITSGWEEIAMNFKEDGSWTPNEEFASSNVVPYIWNSLWGDEDLGYRLANAGYPVVLCNVTNFYFDLGYNKDPREPGLYWGGFVDTRDAFNFIPYDFFKSISTDPGGRPYSSKDFEGKEVLNDIGRGNILGIQGQLWAETLKGQDMLEYYYLPKMLGLAERAWYGQAAWGNISDSTKRRNAIDRAWNVFSNTLGRREFPRLDHLFGGFNYRLAPPGAKIENLRLVVNTAYPGMEVRYTTDGSDPDLNSPLYQGPLEIGSEMIKLSTFDSRGRASLPTVLNLK